MNENDEKKDEIKMPVLNVNTAELRRSGRELGFILCEFLTGLREGIEEYNAALEAAKNADAAGDADVEKQ